MIPLRRSLVCIAAVAAGCLGGGVQYTGSAMTPQIIAAQGTHVYQAPRASVFDAVVGQLKTMGYEIAVAEPAQGIINTGRKYVRSMGTAESNGYSAAGQSTDATRQYLVRVVDLENGQVRVVATPRVFLGTQDISNQNAWDLNDEQNQWNELFSGVQDLLGVGPPASQAGGA